jgi:hypothetical protein
MAKIQEQVIVIRLSKLVKDSEDQYTDLATEEVVASLEQVTQELVASGVVVEVAAG